MHLKLIPSLVFVATSALALAQNPVTIGYQSGNTGPYPWSHFATGPVVLAGTPSTYAFPSNPLTSPVQVSGPGFTGSFDLTLLAATTVAGVSTQLTEYDGRLGVDRIGTSGGSEERNISPNESVTVAISHISLQNTDGKLREIRLSGVSTYGLDDSESLTVTKNGAAAVVLGSGQGSNNATLASFALDLPLAQAGNGDSFTFQLTGATGVVFRLDSLTFSVNEITRRLTSPAEGYNSAGLHPDFRWQSAAWGGVAGAGAYEIQLASDDQFGAPLVDATVKIARFVPAATRLAPGATYHWRVRCLDADATGAWSETAAFTVADFNHYVVTIDGTATVDDVRDAFAAAQQNAPATVRLTSDVSWSSPEDFIFNLHDYANVWFDGANHLITITDPRNGLFQIFNSTNFIFSDFSVDYNPLPYVLCQVTSVNHNDDQIIVKTIHNAANPTLELNDPLLLTADHTHMRLLDPAHPGRIKVGQETYILDNYQWLLESFRNNGEWRYRIQLDGSVYTADNFNIGDLMLRVARRDSRNIMRTVSGTEVCFDHVTAFASPSQFISSIDGSALSVLNSAVALKEGRYSSVTADVVYVRRNGIGPWVENCAFAANGDDCMNFHSIGARIAQQIDVDKLQLAVAGDLNRMAVGDEVAIWDPSPGTTAPVYTTIKAVDPQNSTITTDDPVGEIYLGDSNSAKNSVVYNLTKNNRLFCVKGNLISDNARYGMLISSQDGVVLDNGFIGCASSAVAIGNTPLEGLNTRNLLVESNNIADCGYSGSYFEDQLGAIRANSYGTGWTVLSPLKLHDNLQFIDNVIIGWNSAAFAIHGASNVLFENNCILAGTAGSFNPLSTSNYVFRLSNTSDVHILGTYLDDPRPNDGDVEDNSGVVEFEDF